MQFDLQRINATSVGEGQAFQWNLLPPVEQPFHCEEVIGRAQKRRVFARFNFGCVSKVEDAPQE